MRSPRRRGFVADAGIGFFILFCGAIICVVEDAGRTGFVVEDAGRIGVVVTADRSRGRFVKGAARHWPVVVLYAC